MVVSNFALGSAIQGANVVASSIEFFLRNLSMRPDQHGMDLGCIRSNGLGRSKGASKNFHIMVLDHYSFEDVDPRPYEKPYLTPFVAFRNFP